MNKLFATAQWFVVKVQFTLGAFATAATGIAFGIDPAKSVSAGVLCIGLPSAYFAWISQRTLVGSRILAQGVVKMLSSGALMALFIGFETVEVAWFLLGIVTSQSAYLGALALGSEKHSGL